MEKKQLIDTHCHLYLEEFQSDLGQVMNRAAAEGVSRIYLPALDSAHHQQMIRLEDRYPGQCRAMIGLHPCYVKENFQAELDTVRSLLAGRRFAAIGEIGLDYYWDRSFDAQQQEAFNMQIALAQEYSLPVVIHSRSSMDDCLAILAQYAPLRGIFHCFSGSLEQAKKAIDYGMLLGIGGVITYKNAGLAEVVAGLPLERLVLETDAPYLSPVPLRGKRNESSYLRYIVAKIAEVKKTSEAEVAAATTANALRLFG